MTPDCFAEPCRARFWNALLRLEIGVEQPEAGAKPVEPLDVVHQAPVEVALHRHAVGGGALKLRQTGAHVHDSIGVVHSAALSDSIRPAASVLGDVHPLRTDRYHR